MALPKRYKTKAFWISLAASIICSGAVTLGLLTVSDFRTLNLDHRLALLASYAYLMVGLLLAVTYVIQPNAETGATKPSASHKIATVANFLSGGFAMLTPVIGAKFLPPGGALLVFVLFTGVTTVTNRYFVRYSDEMMRQMYVDMQVMSYRICSTLILLYGAAWALGLTGPIGPWGIAAVLMIIHMGAGIWAGARRGMNPEIEEA